MLDSHVVEFCTLFITTNNNDNDFWLCIAKPKLFCFVFYFKFISLLVYYPFVCALFVINGENGQVFVFVSHIEKKERKEKHNRDRFGRFIYSWCGKTIKWSADIWKETVPKRYKSKKTDFILLQTSIITKHKKTIPDIKNNGTFSFLTSENMRIFH